MIKKVSVVPRDTIKIWAIETQHGVRDYVNKWALISIYGDEGPLSSKVKSNLTCSEYSEYFFHDIETKISKFPCKGEYKLFSKNDARRIIKFINDVQKKDISELVIHCHAGISRSAGVGIFAVRYLGLNESIFHKEHPYIMPNYHVVNLLNKISGLDKSYVQFWKSLEEEQFRIY